MIGLADVVVGLLLVEVELVCDPEPTQSIGVCDSEGVVGFGEKGVGASLLSSESGRAPAELAIAVWASV